MATVLESQVLDTYRVAQPVISFEQAEDLAQRFATPLLCVSRSVVRRNYETMRSAMPGVELFYAAKANPDATILRTLASLGSSIDVCSHREALSALHAGFTPDQMIHTHPCKTDGNMRDCYAEGIRWFTFDNTNELQKMVPYASDISLLMRLAMTSNSSQINLSAKFGAHPDEALGMMLRARELGLHVRALSFHVGSQCATPDGYRTALEKARVVWDQAVAAGIELEMLDIGGGFPAPYRGEVLTLDSFCRSIQSALDDNFGDLNIRVIAEPGRGIAAETATLITKVIGKSVRNGKRWYFLDDGMYGSFSGRVFDHADFPLLAERHDERQLFPCVVAGPTCDSGDVICDDQWLPDLQIGELLLVPTMGAYTNASASAFNGLDIARAIGVE